MSAKVLLVEDVKDLPRGYQSKYDKVYLYNGQAANTIAVPADLCNQIDTHGGYYHAGKILDAVVDKYLSEDQINVLIDEINDKRAELVLKRSIVLVLSDLCVSFKFAERVIQKYGIKGSLDFIPKKFPYSLFDIVKDNPEVLSKQINIPDQYLKKIKRQEKIKNFILTAGLYFYPRFVWVGMCFRGKVDGVKKKIRYAVHIWNGWIISTPPPHRMKILESEKCINSKNALYVVDGKLNKKTLSSIRNSEYEVCYFSEMVRDFSMGRYLKEIKPTMVSFSKKLLKCSDRNKSLLTEIYLKFLRGYIQWSIFFKNYDVNMFVSVQEPANNWRSLFQNYFKSENTFVMLSSTYPVFYRPDIDTYCDAIYGHLIYNYLISSRVSNEYILRNNACIGKSIDVGGIRSDAVLKIKNDLTLKAKLKESLGVPSNKTVIGFFDTTITHNYRKGVFTVAEGAQMFKDIRALLESNSDFFMVYRSRSFLKHMNIKGVKEHLDAFVSHERVIHVNDVKCELNAFDVMGICDLSICCFTGSSVMESLGGGVKTICYTPPDKFKHDEFYLNTFPNLCAYSASDLIKLTNYWLNICNSDEFRDFQDKYTKQFVDQFCDGLATDRLQKYLIELSSGAAGARTAVVETACN